MPVLLAGELEEFTHFLEGVGVYPTLALATVAVFVAAYLIRVVENLIRHLHKKPYLAYGNPRLLLTATGCALVVDGFLISVVFPGHMPLGAATLTTSAGLVCLIASAVWSIVPHIREIRTAHRDDREGAKK